VTGLKPTSAVLGLWSEFDVVNHSTTKDPLKKENFRLGEIEIQTTA